MASWGIFKHAVWMVFANFTDALRVTGVLYVAMFAAQVALVGDIIYDQEAMQRVMKDGSFNWGGFGLYMFLVLVLSMWAAIGWHRFVLLEERPAFLPRLMPGRMITYFGKSIQTTLIIIIVAILSFGLAALIAFAAIYLLSGNQPSVDGIIVATELATKFVNFVGALSVVFFLLRLSPLLPAAALAVPMTLRQAWGKMAGKNGMLFGLSVIVAIAFVILSLPITYFGAVSPVNYVLGFGVGWVQLALWASIFTTLYGIYAEGRALP